VLAPHHAENAEFGAGRLASAEKLFDLLVFFRREAVLANNFWSDGKSGDCGHEEILLSHLERAEERCFLVSIKRGHVAPVSAVESGWQSLPVVMMRSKFQQERAVAMPTRNVNLTAELDRFVATKVKSGRYENASEVVRAGLRTLEREEQQYEAKLAALRAAIDEGDVAVSPRAMYLGVSGRP
jgi:antitoxin ParD1/3/4